MTVAETLDTSAPVLVLGARDHCGMGIIRSLGRLGVQVFAFEPDRRAAAVRSRFLAGRFPWSVDPSRPDEGVERMHAAARAMGRSAVPLPTTDGAAIFLAENAHRLTDEYLVVPNAPGLLRALADKATMYGLCHRLGIPSAASVVAGTLQELLELEDRLSYPVVVKAADGWTIPPDGERTMIVRDRAALADAGRDLFGGGVHGIVVQDYIPGAPHTMWMYEAYVSRDGAPLLSFTGRKVREYPVDKGLTSFGVAAANPRVSELGRRFLEGVGYRGIADLDFRHDERDGQYKLLDVNPRAGATFRLFVDEHGTDVVRAAYRDATGQPVGRAPQRWDRRWMIEDWDLVAARKYIAQRRLSVGAWARSVSAADELVWFAGDDPRPALAAGGRLAAAGLRRLLRLRARPDGD